ncbi:hypothetical protein HDK90DRAFT_249498 [Phyllosticta capitalensis]|uniref:Secreted protein n=1 Tax=Phyllosticta capitalensis TaxID=121624 RepID=A0ABR1YRF0_9PEZI
MPFLLPITLLLCTLLAHNLPILYLTTTPSCPLSLFCTPCRRRPKPPSTSSRHRCRLPSTRPVLDGRAVCLHREIALHLVGWMDDLRHSSQPPTPLHHVGPLSKFISPTAAPLLFQRPLLHCAMAHRSTPTRCYTTGPWLGTLPLH